ncbi:MAG: TRC40/GET3/ArsA family transport-energizing ATPase [Oscillospiraceae bacterium]|nr:TRC40/GET3/ArsA family transport-energizing ATPase [Oscillospiraceae bacterium]
MRVLIYTGKGGVGKTSIAAATAVHLSRMGRKTLIMSTDMAHSLADALETELGNEIRQVCPGLDALELDPNAEGRRAWGSLRDYLRQIISDRANGGLAADEALLFPGLEELFSLLRILDVLDGGNYDALLVDCAPTGETLSLLRYPERLSVLADRLLPSVRSVTKAFGGLISRKTTVPKPRDEVFAEFDRLVKRLSRLQELLRDRDTADLRLVMTPERIVLEEARRSFSWLTAFDFGVDAVYLNRLYPEEALRGAFQGWMELQRESLRLARESFPGQKLFTLPLQDRELRGLESLADAARQLYGDSDPSQVYCRENAFRLEDRMGTRDFILRVPYIAPEDLSVSQEGCDLILRMRNETRQFRLPEQVCRRRVSGWEWRAGELFVHMDYD